MCRVPGVVGSGEFNLAAQSRPAESVAAFRRAPRPDDRAPRSRAGGELITVSASNSTNAGRVLADRTRVLIKRDAHGLGSLYAAPTSEGWICLAVHNLGPPVCEGVFRWFFADPGGPHRCAPLQVYGVLPDDVTSVTVSVRGTRHQATMGENAFYFSDASDDDAGDPQITVRYSDGTSETLP